MACGLFREAQREPVPCTSVFHSPVILSLHSYVCSSLTGQRRVSIYAYLCTYLYNRVHLMNARCAYVYVIEYGPSVQRVHQLMDRDYRDSTRCMHHSSHPRLAIMFSLFYRSPAIRRLYHPVRGVLFSPGGPTVINVNILLPHGVLDKSSSKTARPCCTCPKCSLRSCPGVSLVSPPPIRSPDSLLCTSTTTACKETTSEQSSARLPSHETPAVEPSSRYDEGGKQGTMADDSLAEQEEEEQQQQQRGTHNHVAPSCVSCSMTSNVDRSLGSRGNTTSIRPSPTSFGCSSGGERETPRDNVQNTDQLTKKKKIVGRVGDKPCKKKKKFKKKTWRCHFCRHPALRPSSITTRRLFVQRVIRPLLRFSPDMIFVSAGTPERGKQTEEGVAVGLFVRSHPHVFYLCLCSVRNLGTCVCIACVCEMACLPARPLLALECFSSGRSLQGDRPPPSASTRTAEPSCRCCVSASVFASHKSSQCRNEENTELLSYLSRLYRAIQP